MGHALAHTRNNRSAMSTELKDTIFRFRNGDTGNVRNQIRAECDQAELWSQLRKVIDEIVLPREVTLFADGRPAASLSISNRRLYSVTVASAFRTETPSTDEAEQLAHLLERACASGTYFSLSTTARAPVDTGNGTGCTSRQLLDVLEGQGAPNERDGLATLKESALASLSCDSDGNVVDQFGDDALLEALLAVNRSENETLKRQAKRNVKGLMAQTPSLILPFRDKLNVVVAHIDDSRVIFVARTCDVQANFSNPAMV